MAYALYAGAVDERDLGERLKEAPAKNGEQVAERLTTPPKRRKNILTG